MVRKLLCPPPCFTCKVSLFKEAKAFRYVPEFRTVSTVELTDASVGSLVWSRGLEKSLPEQRRFITSGDQRVSFGKYPNQ